MFIGGAGFASQIRALELGRSFGGGAVDGDIAQHAVHHEGVACFNHARGGIAGNDRLRLSQHSAFFITNFLHDIRIDQIAAIGEHGIGPRHLPGCYGAGTQRHR